MRRIAMLAMMAMMAIMMADVLDRQGKPQPEHDNIHRSATDILLADWHVQS